MTGTVRARTRELETIDDAKTMPQLLLWQARTRGNAVALRHKDMGVWVEVSWQEYAAHVREVALGLRALGVEPGERVAIHSENRPEWVFTDLAAQSFGAISVGLYPTNPAPEVEYLLADSGAVVLFVEDQEQLDKALEARPSLPDLRRIVVIDTRGLQSYLSDPMLLTFDELVSLGRERAGAHSGDDWEAGLFSVDPEECATLIYTSGTTGPPKGVMLSHRNIVTQATLSAPSLALTNADEGLSYLPLCHAAEKITTLWQPLNTGTTVNFAEGIDRVTDNLREVQPTVFLGVPRVWEKLHAAVNIRMHDASLLKRKLYEWSFKMPEPLAWLFVHRALRRRLGLNRVRVAISGAAPIAPEVLAFFESLGIPMYEGWGMSETAGIGALNTPEASRLGSVGKPVPGVEFRIDSDGEILVRGPFVCMGYWKRPDATAAAIDDDGWLHTGDVGHFDDDGFLYITDRKKDIIITAGGKNLSPAEIENKLKVSPFVAEAIVIGDRRKFVSALIGIDLDVVGNWAERQGIVHTTYRDLSGKPEVVALVQGEVDRANGDLASVEQVKQFRLLTKQLDHEDGELTATQKVKRSRITEEFSDVIEEMYS